MSTSLNDRLVELDSLRGFALFGILTVNLTAFASPYFSSGMTDPRYAGPLDQAVRVWISLFFEAKFYLLFSFLFGYSFTLQIEAAERSGAAFVPRFGRRLLGLAVIGLAHALLLFPGDILGTYALMGVLLLGLRELEDRYLLRGAIGLIVAQALLWGGLGALLLLGPPEGAPDRAAMVEYAMRTEAAYRGDVAAVLAQNWHALRTEIWAVLLLLQGPCALAMFLLGLLAGRHQWLATPEIVWQTLRPRLPYLLLGGLSGALVYTLTSQSPDYASTALLGLGVGLLTAPLLSAAYLVLLLGAFRSRVGPLLLRALAPAGRMALSNYLLQSLIGALLFTGYGLKLQGQLAPLPTFLLGLGVFVLQLPLSAWWLRHHQYGPLEWLLRAITVAYLPPWRRQAAASTPMAS
ncbi:DUF418 domain-containing protein [Chitinimonas lacunae]|uniref:DUF418 domain-containing protein n=1 Tax=Chitinimonas lacunae TaxID=1963018 RepID=A0ABV8MMK5_9NEIS